jgi:hypothetical protein
MLRRMHRVQIAIWFAVLCAAWPAPLLAQARDACKAEGARHAWDDRSSPVYADAVDLARTLGDRGFAVVCTRRSKEERLFEGQKGAAWYKTNHGIFEVWFLPKTESFAALEVVEEAQENGRYIYSFRGTPRILVHMDSSKPQFFIEYGNALFQVWGDKQLAASIEKAFQSL